MASFIYCPRCDLPAEVTGQFALTSTDGPIDHVALHCAGGHRYVMAADMLPEPSRRLVTRAAEPHLSSGRSK